MLTRRYGVNDTAPVCVWISGGLTLERGTVALSQAPAGLLDNETRVVQASCQPAGGCWTQQMESGREEQRLPAEPGPARSFPYTIVRQMVVVPTTDSRGRSAHSERPMSSISSETLGRSPNPVAVVSPSVRRPGRALPFPGLLQESHQ